MNFLNKLLTKTKDETTANQNSAMNFLDDFKQNCQQWFCIGNDEHNFSKEVKKSAIDYIGKFGLEKSKKAFDILPELKLAIANYFARGKIKCDTKHIVMRANIFELLQDLYDAIGFEGDEKILFALPISSYFVQQCYDNAINIECLNTNIEDGWKINFADLEASLKNHKIKILFLNCPSNITGAILNQADATAIANILKNNKDLLVVVDESMREMVMDSVVKPVSLASIDNITEQIITISSLKYYGLASLDITFACLRNKPILAELFSQTTNISHTNQYIIISALSDNEDNHKYLAEIVEQCRQNSSLVHEELNIINQNLSQKFGKKDDFIKPFFDEMKAGNTMLLNCASLKGARDDIKNKTIETDLDMAEFLKRETNIAMMPGQCCLLPAEEMILMLYLLKSKQELRAGFKKIGQALMKLKMLSKNVSNANLHQLKTEIENKAR